MLQGKVWGWTVPVWSGNNAEAHLIHGFAGGYCSKHWHRHKHNLFYVLSGVLLVEQWTGRGGKPDATELREGESCSVPPGVKHRFRALTECRALEIYWTDLDPADIIRLTAGGIAETTKRLGAG